MGIALQVLPNTSSLWSSAHNNTRSWTTIDASFFGVGLPHLGVEALVAMSNKLLMHYGCQTVTGWFMHASLSLLFVELGVSFQPLQESYEQYGPLVMHSWFKMLWEKLSRFGITVTVADLSTEYPWDGD